MPLKCLSCNWFNTVTTLYMSLRVKVQGGHEALHCSTFANLITQFRSLSEHTKSLDSWGPWQCVGVAHPGVHSATWDMLGIHLYVRILG